jgi:hypothetical protein
LAACRAAFGGICWAGLAARGAAGGFGFGAESAANIAIGNQTATETVRNLLDMNPRCFRYKTLVSSPHVTWLLFTSMLLLHQF